MAAEGLLIDGLRLGWPPSVNSYWQLGFAFAKGGRKVPNMRVGAPGKAYRADVQEAVWRRGLQKKATGRLSVALAAHPPDRRARDLDNVLKAVLDGLQAAGVFIDDAQVDELTIVRRDVAAGGAVVVWVRELG